MILGQFFLITIGTNKNVQNQLKTIVSSHKQIKEKEKPTNSVKIFALDGILSINVLIKISDIDSLFFYLLFFLGNL